jgi:alkanesulfonate monooxygenase SsuD/methylene tetrahydromethanopterin reductase-like flavin-dependent oxidoreductase (luciferase family)
MVCVNVVAADSDADARFLFTSMQQQFINLRRGSPGPLPAPVDNIHALWNAGEQYGVDQALRMSVIGNETTVRNGLQTLLNETGADEIMVNGQIFDHQARLHSFEIVAAVKGDLVKG